MIKIKLCVTMFVFFNIVDPVISFGVSRNNSVSEFQKRVGHNKERVKRLKRGKGFLEDKSTVMALGGVGGAVGHIALTSAAINSGNTSLAMILGGSTTGAITGAGVLMSVAFTAGGVMAAYPVAKTIERGYQKYNHISPPKFEKRYSAQGHLGKMMHSNVFRTRSMQLQKRKHIEKTELFDEIMIMLARHNIRSFRKERFTFDYGLMFDDSFSDREMKRLQKHRKNKRQLESIAEVMAENLAYIKNKERFLRENFDNYPDVSSPLSIKDETRLLNIKLIENIGVSRGRQHLTFYWRDCPSRFRVEKRLEKEFANQLILSIRRAMKKPQFKALKIKNSLFSIEDMEAWPYESQLVVLIDKQNKREISDYDLDQLIKTVSKYAARDLVQKTSYGRNYYWDNGKLKERGTDCILQETEVLMRAFHIQVEYLDHEVDHSSRNRDLVLDLGWKAF